MAQTLLGLSSYLLYNLFTSLPWGVHPQAKLLRDTSNTPLMPVQPSKIKLRAILPKGTPRKHGLLTKQAVCCVKKKKKKKKKKLFPGGDTKAARSVSHRGLPGTKTARSVSHRGLPGGGKRKAKGGLYPVHGQWRWCNKWSMGTRGMISSRGPFSCLLTVVRVLLARLLACPSFPWAWCQGPPP